MFKIFSKITLLVTITSTLFGFNIVDENSTIYLKPGTNAVKYITIYNFSDKPEKAEMECILNSAPEQNTPKYLINLIKITQDNNSVELPPKSSTRYPLEISAGEKLIPGSYVYWLEVRAKAWQNIKQETEYAAYETYRLPLRIQIE